MIDCAITVIGGRGPHGLAFHLLMQDLGELDDAGRWKNLPPLYPLGAHAVTRAGHAANTLASATVYLPLLMPNILKDAGLAVKQDTLRLTT